MLRVTQLKMKLDHSDAELRTALAQRLDIDESALATYTVARRAHDARRRSDITLIYTIDAALADEAAILARHHGDRHIAPTPDTSYRFVAQAPNPPLTRPIVIGAGPCGLMAALTLAQMGFRPLVLDRGKIVRERTKDTWDFWRRATLHPESNVQFGEGGAGTFSDGKLWSGISDKHHHGRKVLQEFVRAGAPEEILWSSKPHIGTFRLVTVVEGLRAAIEALGGEYRFGAKVDDLEIAETKTGRHISAVILASGERIQASQIVLAIGHSARDTMAMLHASGVRLDAKPLSIGVRIEHPQALIDRARFGDAAGNPRLGAADYKLVHHCGPSGPAANRSVYSFCMCPGGTVVAAASEPGRLVTNGMSQYSRNERNANAGLVVGLEPDDFIPYGGASPLAGIEFQRHWEEKAFAAGGSDYHAPAQRVGDFLAGRPSTTLGAVIPSYKPGVRPTDLAACLPGFAVAAIRDALPAFDRQIRGFAMADAVMTGIETRTSSPVRIPRAPNGQSLNTKGLFPAGEGAGYAGGILSAAVDGIRAAEALVRALLPTQPA